MFVSRQKFRFIFNEFRFFFFFFFWKSAVAENVENDLGGYTTRQRVNRLVTPLLRDESNQISTRVIR